MTTRRLALATFLAAILVAVVAGLTLYFALPARGGTHEIDLQGVDGDELAGWGKVLEPDIRSPAISAAAAIATSSTNKPGAKPLETVLVRLVNDSRQPPLDAIAWAVNFDPKTVEVAPIGGPIGYEHPRVCGQHPQYDVVFIDAQTGELIFELQNSGPPGNDPSATCPAETTYPSPTAVPGQPTAVP
ncbi:MAG TPA: hypothetical protein VLS25_08930 [Dehalococcoidia bacterium]|nr:hypothetical protein [Dehalococcoidia bacterium]